MVALLAACGSPARPAPAEPDTRAHCVAVIELLDAQVFRGTPESQALWDSLDTPEEQEYYDSESHGEQYLRCTFEVRIGGAAYLYEHNGHQSTSDDDLDAALCETPEEAADVIKDVELFTDNCTDLHGGEYWGEFLRPR